MPSPFPHQYRVRLAREGQHVMLRDGAKPPIVAGPPPEFGGSPLWWSPEHLLLSAVGLCFAATFEALASRSAVVIESFAAEAAGALDKTSGGIVFTSIGLQVQLTVAAGQAELAERLLESAKRNCIVANSLKTPVDLRARIKEEAALPAGRS
jgi:organic hydroperoxide reductase OsmC/OhrA